MVIDPSLFTRPVSVAQWRDSMRKSPTSPAPIIRLTRLGEAPVKADGKRAAGSGYWLEADPAGGVDRHAREKMREYKAKEPRPR